MLSKCRQLLVALRQFALGVPKKQPNRLQIAAASVALVLFGAVLNVWVSRWLQDEPHIVAYYRGEGQHLQSGQSWTVELKRSRGDPLPYFIGPFEITNEGDATTPKDVTAALDCSSQFYPGWPGGDPAGLPRQLWQGYPLIRPGHPAIRRYMYMHRIGVIGPGESQILHGFRFNPSEPEVRCELIVTSGTKKPTTLDLSFKLKDHQ